MNKKYIKEIDNYNNLIREKQLELLNLKNEKHKFYKTLFSVGEVVLVKIDDISQEHIRKSGKCGQNRKFFGRDEEMVIMEINTRIPGDETIIFGSYCKETNTLKSNFYLKGYRPCLYVRGDYFRFIKKTNKKVEMPKNFKIDCSTDSIYDSVIYKIIYN